MQKVSIYIVKYEVLPERSSGSWYTRQGRKLLCYALGELTGENIEPQIELHPGGKPYLKNRPFYFNISHSVNYIVCAVGLEPLGIDIQYHHRRDVEKIAKRVLNPEEWADYECAEDRVRYFYDRWSEKESYLKYTGEGIRVDMRKLFIEEALQHIEVDKGYSCCLCTRGDCECEVICCGREFL